MNPQYMSQYGAPNLQNRPPPTISPQGFQNIPLGVPKPIPQSTNTVAPDSFGPPSVTNHNATVPPNQFGPPQNVPPITNQNVQNSVPPNINQNYPTVSTNQFPTNMNQLPLKPTQPPANLYNSQNIPGQGFNPTQNLNNDLHNTRPPNVYNQPQTLNNDVNAAHFQQPPMMRPPSGQPPFQQPHAAANNSFNASQPSRPPLIGQPPISSQPSMVGHVSGPGETQLQDGSMRPPSIPVSSTSQYGQPQQPLPKGPFPSTNLFVNNLPNHMQNMNISGPRQYVNDNDMHGPPPIGPKQGFPPRSGQVPGFPPMPGQPPLQGHADASRMVGGGMPPMSGSGMPPMGGGGMPSMTGGGMPPMTSGGMPPMSGSGMPPMSGAGMPSMSGSGMPPMSSGGIHPMSGGGMPSMPGGGMPPMPGGGMPPMPGGGMPPMPGQGPLSPVSGPYPQQYQPPQPKRLDPDQMPSPIQVMQDDQRTRSGVFCTNQKGLVPPLITTNFQVQDQGNASPRYIRSTMYNVPVTQDLMKQTAVPFGLIISPMARTVGDEYPPPIVNFSDLGPVRCIRCKAYMSPYMQFIDAGRRFQCLFCKATTDVPAEYFQHLDHTGQRADRFERPELILGTYEFTATADYCRDNKFPKPPAVIFVIDVSYNNVKSGLVHLLCSQMKDIIKNLPVDQGHQKSNMRVGFITYNSSVQFYNIKGTLAAPQMLVVGDVHDMFMPLLDGFLCTPEESEVVIDALMQQIPSMYCDTRETETILLPAILAGLEALKASECPGKLLVFHSSLPIADAPGRLKNRDDRKLLGTDKERTILTPQTNAYNQLGQDCVAAGCSVDLFLLNNSYIDVATIGQVARLTGGEIFKYTYFQADVDGNRLIQDIITDISRPIAFDTTMRVRTSTGIRPTDFYGHFYMSNTTDMEIAAIDCDKAVGVEIKHDDKLTEEDGVYIQVALLYTSVSGQRRLRIINLSLKTCSQMSDLYRCCELDTIINFFGKQSMYRLLENNPKNVKDSIVARAAQMLANYRKNCATPSSAGQLILPECMKLLPLYVNCLLKSDAMSGGSDITVDDRSFMMHAVMMMDIATSVSYFYPRLIPLADIKPDPDGRVEIPQPIRSTIEKTNDQGAYILENGIHMFFYIGLALNPEFCQQVFGVPTAVQVNIELTELPVLDNPLSIAVRSIVNQVRTQKHRCMRLTFVRQREKLEPVFKHFLVEDRGIDASPSYVDFLCHMHKEIRTILS